jgi:hypothetical protein
VRVGIKVSSITKIKKRFKKLKTMEQILGDLVEKYGFQ